MSRLTRNIEVYGKSSMWVAWLQVAPNQVAQSNMFTSRKDIKEHFRNPMTGMYRPDLIAITPANQDHYMRGEGL